MMDKIVLYTFVVGLLKCVHGSVNVTDLKMPDSIKLGSTDEIVLDCDFQAPPNEPGLVIQWFFNGDDLIYQYIPEYKVHGSHREFWKQRLDLEFKISEDDSTMFRALKIHNISKELTGNYTCKVSSDNNEDSETKQLIVYSPPTSKPDIILFESESLVICTVQGISPDPHMDFYIKSENGTRTDVSEEVEMVEDGDGLFNVTGKHYFSNLTLPGLTIFVCNLSIPGTDYIWSHTREYRHENSNFEEFEEETNLNMTSLDNSTEVKEHFSKLQEGSGAIQQHLSYGLLLLLLLWVMCLNK